jgi:uncharacterized protein (DUF1499 family)
MTERVGVLLCSLFLVSCGGAKPESLGVNDSRLGDCPESPNCISSEAHDEEHRARPYRLRSFSADTWQVVQEQVAAMPRTNIITATDTYLHAECRSPILGFVDDLELNLRAGQAQIQVRSASRVGYSDLGVNRRRVETLRERLRSAGLTE